MPSVFAGAFSGSVLTAVGVWNFVSSSRPWPSGAHHCDVDSDVVEPDDTVHPTSLDWRLALQLHTKFDKERSSSLKVVDNDADVVHPLNRHIPEHRDRMFGMSVRVGVVCSWISASVERLEHDRCS
jgi:hypothetical protein